LPATSACCGPHIVGRLVTCSQVLAILEVLLAAVERRHDVVEAVWNSSNDDQASSRLRDVVDIPDGLSAQLILDLQIRLLTKKKRDALTAEVSHLRQLVQRPSK
jgi:DNA gyrase/topoisomerase IV subunit A